VAAPTPLEDLVTAPAPLARRLTAQLPDRLTSVAAPAPPDGRFAWLVAATSTWILVGLFVDGWFHIHDDALEGFFTPWHGLLYSGVAAAVVVHLLEGRRAGGLRPGFGLSLVGGLVVSLAGFVDMVWHTVLGVEADLDALLSPPHLLLITAGTLVFAGPVRAAVLGGRAGLPTALCAAYVVTGLAFFTQYANPFTHLYPVAGYSPVDAGGIVATASADLTELREVAGVAGVLVFAALVGGAVALVRALEAPALSTLAVVVMPVLFLVSLRGTWFLLPAAVLAGLAAEALRPRLAPAGLAAASCALLLTGWVASLVVRHDVAWSVELLTGSVASAAAAGFLAGWLVQTGLTTGRGRLPA
jgi:hypothetical protein